MRKEVKDIRRTTNASVERREFADCSIINLIKLDTINVSIICPFFVLFTFSKLPSIGSNLNCAK
jgi:hypothetical protein